MFAHFFEQGLEALTTPIHVVVSRASKSAIKAIEAGGGSVVCQYYNELALKDLVQGRTDRKMASPIRKPDIRELLLIAINHLSTHAFSLAVWYTDSRNRGYLSPLVKNDEEGLKVEIESRRAKREQMRPTQPQVAYPVYKMEDMRKVPDYAQAP